MNTGGGDGAAGGEHECGGRQRWPWLPYPTGAGWRINSIGAFNGRGTAYQMAILTAGNASMSYGITTIQAAARVINRDIREA